MTNPELDTFREEVRGDVEAMIARLDPEDDVFPHLWCDAADRPSTRLLIHVGQFFSSGTQGKEIFVRIALPLILRKTHAMRIAFVSPVWMGKFDDESPEERERLAALADESGIFALPEHNRTEGVMVRISDGNAECDAIAELTRHPGAPPTIAWNREMEQHFPEAKSKGRMGGGFLVAAFQRAATLTPQMVMMAEALLGIGYEEIDTTSHN